MALHLSFMRALSVEIPRCRIMSEAHHHPAGPTELSPNLGDGLRVQAAAVWDFEDAGLAATSIPSVNLTP